MKVPKFSRWITIPVLLLLNIGAWIYVYDDYLMGWVVVYPVFMLIAAGFTTAAELAFGRDRKFKYVGINICIVLLLFIFAQKYIPMEKIENGLLNNYYGHVYADAQGLNPADKAVRNHGYTIVARNFNENRDPQANQVDILEAYKDGSLLDKVTLGDALAKVMEVVPKERQGEFSNIIFYDARYVGVKRKGGEINLLFQKGYVDFKYNLAADDGGFIWNSERYKFDGISLPAMEGLYGDETNQKIKEILMKGKAEQVISVQISVKGDQNAAMEDLKQLGYQITSVDPITVLIPFYEIANLSRVPHIKSFEIK
ncbi:MAG: hypothetical protein ACOYVD_03275 [Bacillota bacterium]